MIDKAWPTCLCYYKSTLYYEYAKSVCFLNYSSIIMFPCSTACTQGLFGAGCAQDCHCSDGVACNSFTGECFSGSGVCADGWSGTNCQSKNYSLDVTKENLK